MTKTKSARWTVVFLATVTSAMMLSQVPALSIDAGRHPDLAAAQVSIGQAYKKIDAAQQAHRGKLGGHAEKAQDLLSQASQELKLAAEYADHHK